MPRESENAAVFARLTFYVTQFFRWMPRYVGGLPVFLRGSDPSCWLLVHAPPAKLPITVLYPRPLSHPPILLRADRRPRHQNQVVYNYPVLREALNVMSQVPAADQQGGGSKQIPLLLMRTVLESVQRFPELKNFVATVVLVRLVQHQVGVDPIGNLFDLPA